MFDWLKRTFAGNAGPVPGDARFLGVDMHAHWLPGLDDGAKTMDDSLEMIEAMVHMGYRKLIATPHIMADLYRNTPQIIDERLAEVKAACIRENIPVVLEAAAEYLIDDGFEEHLRQYGALRIAERHILVEFGFFQPPPNIEAIFFRLQADRLRPILAHPERYTYYHQQVERLRAFADRGVLLQLNLLSLSGTYGERVRRAAGKLLDDKLITFLGTDAHHIDHVHKLTTLLTQPAVAPLNATTFANHQLTTA